jgi:hypothetical protein
MGLRATRGIATAAGLLASALYLAAGCDESGQGSVSSTGGSSTGAAGAGATGSGALLGGETSTGPGGGAVEGGGGALGTAGGPVGGSVGVGGAGGAGGAPPSCGDSTCDGTETCSSCACDCCAGNGGTFDWSGRRWTAFVNGQGSAGVVESGWLRLTLAGWQEACNGRCGVDVISCEPIVPDYGYQLVTTDLPSAGTPGWLTAPLWMARVPWEVNGEMDIERFSYDAVTSFVRYVVWQPLAPDPDFHWTFWDETAVPYPVSAPERHTIEWFGPDLVVFASDQQSGGDWVRVRMASYSGPEVPDAGDPIHLWVSLYANPNSTPGPQSMTLTSLGAYEITWN